MSETFTPGPWAVNWAGSGRDGHLVYDEVYVYAPASGVEDIAVAADIADPTTGKPSKANADLIAAAPCLLAALQACMPFIDDASEITQFFPDSAASASCREAVKQARAAIAHALPQGEKHV